MIVEKKIWPQYFDDVASGKKRFELRLGDFDIAEGDTLLLREWDPDKETYTGRQIETEVTNVLKTKDQTFWSKEEADRYGFQIIQIEPK